MTAAAICDDKIVIREHHLVAGATAGVSVEDVEQGKHVTQPEHQERHRIQDALAIRQLRIVTIKPVEWWLLSHDLFL